MKNLKTLYLFTLSLFFLIAPAAVYAAGGVAGLEDAARGLSGVAIGNESLKALAGAFAIAIGALGGALAQGRLGAAAMEGIARNPQAGKTMFVPFIIGLALIESLVIYCLIIAFPLTQG